jgi:hypothetical protein
MSDGIEMDYKEREARRYGIYAPYIEGLGYSRCDMRSLARIAVNGRLDITPERMVEMAKEVCRAHPDLYGPDFYDYTGRGFREAFHALGMDYTKPIVEALSEAGFVIKAAWVRLHHTSVNEQRIYDNRIPEEYHETISKIKVSRGRIGKWVELTDYDVGRIVTEAVSMFPETDHSRIASEFRKCMGDLGAEGSTYPTTYGIGVWLIYNPRFGKDVETVERIIGEAGLDFCNEYSDKHWVYRFKISKAKENLARIKKYRESVMCKTGNRGEAHPRGA